MSSICMHCVSPLNVTSLQLLAFTVEKEVCEAIFDDSNILYIHFVFNREHDLVQKTSFWTRID